MPMNFRQIEAIVYASEKIQDSRRTLINALSKMETIGVDKAIVKTYNSRIEKITVALGELQTDLQNEVYK